MKFAAVFLCIFSQIIFTHAQNTWEKAHDKEGIVIFTRTVEGKNIKEFRAHMNLDARMSTVASILTTGSNYPNWVYKVSAVNLLKGETPEDTWSRYIIDMPWPLSDRDGISHTQVEQVSPDKLVIRQRSDSDYLPEKEGFVRLALVKSSWTVERKGDGKLAITYQSLADPGDLPNWLVNAFLLDSPKETLKALSKEVKKPQFAKVELDWVRE